MLVKDWFNYVATLLLTGVEAKEATVDGELGTLCPCFSKTTDGEINATESNERILKMYTEDGDTSIFLKMGNRRSITSVDTIFTLFKRDGPKNGTRIHGDDPEGIVNSGYDPFKTTVVAAHGFHSNDHTEWMMQLKKAQLTETDVNFVTVDWSMCADNCCYYGARDCAIAVGGYLEQLLQTFVLLGADSEQFHLLGHSLGAHLVSQTANNGLRMGRISAFDPPQWGFNLDEPMNRVDPSDAILVDVIHTTSVLGWNVVLGHLDFFPNGAGTQPGCSFFNTVCSHSMSYYYYIQSLYHKKKYPAYRCESLKAATKGVCNGPIAYMGVGCDTGKPGIYYLHVEVPATGEP